MNTKNHLVRYTDAAGRINFVAAADLENQNPDAMIDLRDTYGEPLRSLNDHNRVLRVCLADVKRGKLEATKLKCP